MSAQTIAFPGRPERLAATDLRRQAAHWRLAAESFLDAEQFAPADAWAAIESQTGLPLRTQLAGTVNELVALAGQTDAAARRASSSAAEYQRAEQALQLLRQRYTQVETTLDFFGDAVATRTSAELKRVLQLLDGLAHESMAMALSTARIPAPPVLCYVRPGLGASILKAGIRLWSPGTINPVAAIKIVRHNLFRPTSLFHESGHQVAHLTGWTESMRAQLAQALADDDVLRSMWTSWASEIAADVFAFLHTGYAAVPALFDVVSDARTVMRWPLGDPHPIGWLRTRLGCALCREAWGAGPWDDFETAVLAEYPVQRAEESVRPLLERSARRLPELARACLYTPVPRFGGKPMTAALPPQRVSPQALGELERALGAAAWTSSHWRTAEGIRLIALAGLREAESAENAQQWAARARQWMTAGPVAA